MRAAVAAAAGVSANREFELLRRLGGTDLPGAIRAVEVGDSSQCTEPTSTSGDDQGDDQGDDDPLLKFSLAGAQLKFSVSGDGRGLTVPVRGTAGDHILKFPDGRPGFEFVPEREHAAMTLARAAGFDVAPTRLVSPGDVAGLERWAQRAGDRLALLVDRFDRLPDGRRVHQEELAQVHDIPTRREGAKYRLGNFELVAVYAEALTGPSGAADVIDRIVLNVLVGNGDAHLKNWAFTYPDGRTPHLSPVYDVLPTVLYVVGDDLGMNLDGTKRFDRIEAGSFATIGRRTALGARAAVERATRAAERVLAHWSVFTDALDGPAARTLTERLHTLPLARPHLSGAAPGAAPSGSPPR